MKRSVGRCSRVGWCSGEEVRDEMWRDVRRGKNGTLTQSESPEQKVSSSQSVGECGGIVAEELVAENPAGGSVEKTLEDEEVCDQI